MISKVDDWVGRILGIPIEAELRVPVAVAAGMLVIGTVVCIAALTLIGLRRLRQRL